MREPLSNMSLVEKCRWFARNLMELCNGYKNNTEYEEAIVFEEAANEIERLQSELRKR